MFFGWQLYRRLWGLLAINRRSCRVSCGFYKGPNTPRLVVTGCPSVILIRAITLSSCFLRSLAIADGIVISAHETCLDAPTVSIHRVLATL